MSDMPCLQILRLRHSCRRRTRQLLQWLPDISGSRSSKQPFHQQSISVTLLRDQLDPVALGILVGGIQEPENSRPLDISVFMPIKLVLERCTATGLDLVLP